MKVREPKVGDKVIIKKGFYEGVKGIIYSETNFFFFKEYLIELNLKKIDTKRDKHFTRKKFKIIE